MTFDVKAGTDNDIEISQVGDVARVKGEDRILQQIATAALAEIESNGVPQTATERARIEGRLGEQLATYEYIDTVLEVSVTVESDTSVSVSVKTTSAEYTEQVL